MKIAIIVQARMTSTRLPGKVLKPVLGKPLLAYQIERLQRVKLADEIVIATTTNHSDEPIVELCNSLYVAYFRGSETDVLARYYQAARIHKADVVVRVTSDCPLLDPELVDHLIQYTVENNLNYCATSLQYPDGVDVEVFRFSELEEAYYKAYLQSDKEHVTPFIRRKDANSQPKNLFPCEGDFENIRFTVDELKDFQAIEKLINTLGAGLPWKKYVDFIINQPSLFSNQKIVRNEGYLKSLQKEN